MLKNPKIHVTMFLIARHQLGLALTQKNALNVTNDLTHKIHMP
jgi:hypothetical protein